MGGLDGTFPVNSNVPGNGSQYQVLSLYISHYSHPLVSAGDWILDPRYRILSMLAPLM